MPFHSDIIPQVNAIQSQIAAMTAAASATAGVTARYIASKLRK